MNEESGEGRVAYGCDDCYYRIRDCEKKTTGREKEKGIYMIAQGGGRRKNTT